MVSESKGRRALIFVAAVVVFILFVQPAIMSSWAIDPLEGDGDKVREVRHDQQYDLYSYYPKSEYSRVPLPIYVEGIPGEQGHIAYGEFSMAGAYEEPYVSVGAKVRLDSVDFEKDTGVTRVAIATMWKPTNANSTVYRYYVEFDIYTSPEWNDVVEVIKYNHYEPYGDEPTIEYKIDQLEVGETGEWKIPAEKYFRSAYLGASAELDAAYLVIRKGDASSVFTMELTLLEFWLYRD